MDTQALLAKHAELWQRATHHPFLEGVRRGDLAPEVFARWLSQDYLFVDAGLKAQCLLLAQAPRRDQPLLAQGVAALTAELDWFEEHLRARGLSLDIHPSPTCRAYSDFLIVQAQAVYPAALLVAATAERAYHEAWTGTLPAAPAYQDVAARWAADTFGAYVRALAQAADRALAEASPSDLRAAEDAFVWTAYWESAFWQMAFDAAG